MANADRPRGFLPYVGRGKGAPCPPKEYPAATTNEPIARGDLISLTTAGSVDRTCIGGGGGHDQTTVIGVCESVRYYVSGRIYEGTYLPAATGNDTMATAVVKVWDDPDQLFVAQVTDGINVTQTYVGNCAEPIATEATDGTRVGLKHGHSIQEIDTPSAQTALLKVEHILRAPDNESGATSVFTRLVVSIAEHFYAKTATATNI
jgi:hypothetical protein